MAEFLGPVCLEMYKDLKGLFRRHAALRVDYAMTLQEKHKNLMEEVKKLRARKDDIVKNSRKDEGASNECKNWIGRVKVVEKEVRELEVKYNNEGKHSCRWVHCCSRYELSKDMVEKTKKVEILFEEGERWIEGTSVDKPLKLMRRKPPLDSEYMLPVHKVTEEKLVSFLRDEKIRRIGLWGIAGSGKTTIMNNLMSNEDSTSMFETVILVTILDYWGVKELQDDIMRQLKLDMEDSADMVEKSARILKELQTKKCLILLDNFEREFELDEILGIHDNQHSSKVVLASRSRDICIEMKAGDLIHVERLSPDDAWIMFKEIVGGVIDQFPRIEEVARLVAKECDGLPLLIDTVARNLRNDRDYSHWKSELKQLRTWKNRQGMDEVLQSLECCYNGLDDATKDCFLYGALYPEECKIYVDHLLECWISEGFIHDTSSFRDARDAGHSILRDLINVSFLVRTENSKYVKMNKWPRTMALKISSQNNHYKLLVKPSDRLQYSPQNKEWHEASRISLMDSQLKKLPGTLDCANLLTLFLQRNKDLLDIPKMFFESMRSLQVVDLYGTGIASLPSSLSKLVCLKALYLNSCFKLMKLPSGVKALKCLEVLDIRGTKLDLLQVRSLIWLRCLRISFSNLPKVNHRKGIVSGFCSLEEFSICIDSSQQWIDNIAEATTREVATLKKLTSLQFCFPNLDCLKLFVERSPVWKDNSSFTFQFTVGCQDSAHSPILESVDYPIHNSLKLVDTEGTDEVFGKVLKETDVFGLIKHKQVYSLSDFDTGNMEKMLVCLIEGCDDIEVIIRSTGKREAVLRVLKDLYLRNLLNLVRIWQGHVPDGSLAQLTTLIFSKCPNLKNIFSKGLIQQLHGLQYLKVEECHQIEEIIMKSENRGLIGNALPSLKNLELVHLPRLRSILDDSFKWDWPSLDKIKISTCDELTRLPFRDQSATKLRRIEGQKSWWEALEWEDQAYKQRLYLLFHPL